MQPILPVNKLLTSTDRANVTGVLPEASSHLRQLYQEVRIAISLSRFWLPNTAPSLNRQLSLQGSPTGMLLV